MTGLETAWIDYKKAFHIVPHSWLKKCMMMFVVAENMQKVLSNSMYKSKTELTSRGQVWSIENNKRHISGR